jgi:Fe/S biogenesis protein NfuA
MLTFTDAAREMVRTFMAQNYVEEPALRITAVDGGSPLAPDYEFALVEARERDEDDLLVEAGGFTVIVDLRSAARIDGAVVDYVVRDGESGFEVRAPGKAARAPAGGGTPADGELAERVRRLLDERVNPAVASHGGSIDLVAVDDHVAYVEMSGGCQGCGMARVTLRQGVERMIRDAIPEILEVRDVTDHMAGTNPYYRPADS